MQTDSHSARALARGLILAVLTAAAAVLVAMCQPIPSRAQDTVATLHVAQPTIAGCMVSLSGLDAREAADLASDYYGLPSWLLARVIDRRENRGWDPHAVSIMGAVGLTQIRPSTVCWRVPGCNSADTHRLGVIEGKLKGIPYNLCWGARILSDNAAICRGDLACTLAGFYAGEGASGYIADILR